METSSQLSSPSSSSSCSSAHNSSSSSSSVDKPKYTAPVVIRQGHIIPSIRLTPPDSRPEKSEEVPEQNLESSTLFVPLRTEEIGWEEGGLIWAAKRYCYPVVNLYGGVDDHVIGSYRGGPKGYRYINITDKAFALTCQDDDDISEKVSKTSKDGRKSSMPKGPATQIQQTAPSPVEEMASPADASTVDRETDCAESVASSSTFSSPCSSRRGSSSTDDDTYSDHDTGMTTPTEEYDSPDVTEKQYDNDDMAEKLQAALTAAVQHQEANQTTRLASRTGYLEISTQPVLTGRLAGPIKSQLSNNCLGLDRSMTLSESVPASHFQSARGRSSSRRINDPDYSAGWSYEQNMRTEFSQ